tara:strand:+ start:11788 stop:11973 length:186 start_codon:yes stop_codon:yes gene_type:complete
MINHTELLGALNHHHQRKHVITENTLTDLQLATRIVKSAKGKSKKEPKSVEKNVEIKNMGK